MLATYTFSTQDASAVSGKGPKAGGFWQRFFAGLEDTRSVLPRLPTVPAVKPPAIGELTQIVINGAFSLAADHRHRRVTDWHLLAALLATDPVQRALLKLEAAELIEELTFERLGTLPGSRLREGESPELGTPSLQRAAIQAMSQQVPTLTVLHLMSCVTTSPEVSEALHFLGIDTTALAVWPRYKDAWPQSDRDVMDDEEVELLLHNDDTTSMDFVEHVLGELMDLPLRKRATRCSVCTQRATQAWAK